MKFYSTAKNSPPVDLRTAVVQGLAPDRGLYLPEIIPPLPRGFFEMLPRAAFNEIAMEVGSRLLGDDISRQDLERITEEAFSFDAPLRLITDGIYCLELFHGPTLAFKDFGACFMARLLAQLRSAESRELVILTATSGDTGSAVAHGFFGVRGIRVIILYPRGKVSFIQEQQLTTLGGNITALEVEGTFDDCQRLVKEAFLDQELRRRVAMSSANSINIARLIPQSFYYFRAWAQLPHRHRPAVCSVPSGNFGNLTAGLLAKRMGLPIERFVAATNSNAVIPRYLQHGTYAPHPSLATISNAMDVGDPSNFARMLALYDNSHARMQGEISGYSFSDEQTLAAMRAVYQDHGYLLDPHGAVGYLGLQALLGGSPAASADGVFLETAHPAKFVETVKKIAGEDVEIPERLRACLDKEKQAVPLRNSFPDLKELLLHGLN